MLDEGVRGAVLVLVKKGHSRRQIAKALKISRASVANIAASGEGKLAETVRAGRLDEFHEELVGLYRLCRGNVVRVHEMFDAVHSGLASYPTLTRYLRMHGVVEDAKTPAGEYEFAPGEEMQHDTSPHDVVLGGCERRLQCASVILAHSRMIYMQVFERFTRLEARIFLTEALVYFGGAAKRCVVDNTSVVRHSGTGVEMVPAAGMAAFASHFGFTWLAHELGDCNRKGRVERPFHYIEHNFYPGRKFADMADCNRQALQWCEKVNQKYRKRLRSTPVAMFATECVHLQPLPLHVPEPYELHFRTVDESGFVTVHTNRYSAPVDLLGRLVDVREHKDEIRVFFGPRQVAVHRRQPFGQGSRNRLPEHRVQRGESRRVQRQQPSAAEVRLRGEDPGLGPYIDELRRRKPGRGVLALQQLERMWMEYPHESVLAATQSAQAYGLYDLQRLERMVLRHAGGDLFGLTVVDTDVDEFSEGGQADV